MGIYIGEILLSCSLLNKEKRNEINIQFNKFFLLNNIL